MKTQLFTIQQYAELHEIGKRTLHFYDQIGLFSPAVKKENGYRYYSLAQGAVLEMILTLRELDMPLDVIKRYMQKRNPEDFDTLLVQKQREIQEKIAQLKEIKTLLNIKREQLNDLKSDLAAIEVVPCKAKHYAVTPVADADSYVDAMIQHGKSLPHHLFNMELGTMNHSDHLFDGLYNHTDAIFSNMGARKGNHERAAGNYVRAFHQGDFNDLSATYRRILDYCRQNALRPEGYAYEVGVNDLCVMEMDEYVTMIEVRVRDC